MMNPPPQFDSRDEYEWEQALKDSDSYAARYFQLLKRFSDLPEGDTLIAKHLAEEFTDQAHECDFDCENCANQWHCGFLDDSEFEGLFSDDDPADPFSKDEGPEDEKRDLRPGDSLFFEAHPAYQLLQHCAMGWCNIYAAVLSPEDRRAGLRTLFYFGRALAHLSSSIGDGLYDSPAASIAFAKRSLHQVNLALGEMQRLCKDRPQFGSLLKAMGQHLLKARSTIYDHLQQCRRRGSEEDE